MGPIFMLITFLPRRLYLQILEPNPPKNDQGPLLAGRDSRYSRVAYPKGATDYILSHWTMLAHRPRPTFLSEFSVSVQFGHIADLKEVGWTLHFMYNCS